MVPSGHQAHATPGPARDSFTDLKLLQRRRTSHSAPPPPPLKTPQFSTLDRTILEELKRNLSARQSQFVLKRGGHKHHPYRPKEVPYPRSYQREVVDLDVWETLWCQQLCGSPTWHLFDEPPTRVLDIGCGTGSWVLDCARLWKNCHFVGLDIVPLHPDLQQVGSPDLAKRITWVQDNFLDRLPFPNEEFDFVHVKRIARGVPEDKWDALFEEITRVMRPGAAFEMIEEDLDFPGHVAEDDAYPDSDADADPLARSHSSLPAHLHSHPHPVTDSDAYSLTPSDSHSHPHSHHSRPDSLASQPSFPLTPPPSSPPTPPTPASQDGDQMSTIVERNESQQGTPRGPLTPQEDPDQVLDIDREGTQPTPPPRPHAPEPPSPASSTPSMTRGQTYPYPSKLLNPQMRNEPPTLPKSQPCLLERSGGAHMYFPPPPPPPQLRRAVTSTPSLEMGNQTARGPPVARKLFPLLPSISTASLSSSTFMRPPMLRSQSHFQTYTQVASRALSPSPTSPDSPFLLTAPSHPGSASTKPFLLRSVQGKPPRNPRDHAMLEMIYTEMHSARFINLTPLSLLGSSLSTYFKDVRTHPPLVLTFPPLVPNPPSRHHTSQSSTSESDEFPNELKFPKHLQARIPSGTTHSQDEPEGFDDRYQTEDSARFVSMEGLLVGASPYVSLDMTRLSALSPSARTAFPTAISVSRDVQSASRAAPAGSPVLDRQESAMWLDEAASPTVSNPALSPAVYSSLKVRLPNTTMNFDLRTLNLHLSLRASEVIACAEAMWEWVVEYQKHEHEHGSRASLDPLKSEISELTRADFDDMMARFEMDMRDNSALGPALEDRFVWNVSPSSKTQERKVFDTECDKWGQYQREQQRRQRAGTDSNSSTDFRTMPSHGRFITGAMTKVMTATGVGDEDGASTLQQQLNRSHRTGDIIAPGDPSRQHRRAKTESSTLISGDSRSDDMLPTPSPSVQRICRAMRVFVAWKA